MVPVEIVIVGVSGFVGAIIWIIKDHEVRRLKDDNLALTEQCIRQKTELARLNSKLAAFGPKQRGANGRWIPRIVTEESTSCQASEIMQARKPESQNG